MSSLQLGLIVAGVALVAGVIVYNAVQERRLRRRLAATSESMPTAADGELPAVARKGERVEPSLAPSADRSATAKENPPSKAPAEAEWVAPVETIATVASEIPADDAAPAPAAAAVPMTPAPRGGWPQPDPEIECVVALQPVRPATAGALAAGLHARLGKRLRWFGGRGEGTHWKLLKSDTTGEFSEIVACMLLADRSGASTRPMLDAFARLVGDVAASLPAACVPPDIEREVERAEALDRICADLDVQIGLTVLKAGPTPIAGTRLRGVAEAAGFRLAEGGRFDWVQEETGAVLFSLTNYRSEPFTADALRVASTPGAVFLLDVPRVADPVRVFDQMKMAARRMAQTLDATLVDDNRRPIDDAAFAAIREQVKATVAALRESNIDPGGPRAMALFGG